MTTDYADMCRAAERHLAEVAAPFAELIERVGPCSLTPEPDLFRTLVRAMIAQFISTAAARSITGRLETRLKGKLTATGILKLTDEDFQTCGIRGGKLRSIRELAEHFRANRKFARSVLEADDEGVRKLLLPLRGIGPWTVDMILMFGLARPDVLPVGDLGLRAGVRDLFQLPELPEAKALQTLAESWRPYRTIATWYVWRSRGWVPQSGNEG